MVGGWWEGGGRMVGGGGRIIRAINNIKLLIFNLK